MVKNISLKYLKLAFIGEAVIAIKPDNDMM